MTRNKLSCAICQPNYLPWIGYFEMIDRVDLFVFLDDVQFIKREWKNRNRIRKSATSPDVKWLTVPIDKDDARLMIKNVFISPNRDWVTEHYNSLRAVYHQSTFFDRYSNEIKAIMSEHSKGTLADLNIGLIGYFCKTLGIKTRLIRSSAIGVGGKREEKLLNICKALAADLYLANNATVQYVGAGYFAPHGIKLEAQNYRHPQYIQRYKNKTLPFISHLSIVDLLFNTGDKSRNIIIQGRPADSILCHAAL